VIGTFHRCVVEEISRFGGSVARFMGDGALVYFGYPQAHEDDAERAVRAGLAAIAAVSKLTLIGGYMPQMRVGIATGLVVVGDITGIGVNPEQDVTGETPNLAARLQSITEPNAIVIADSTRRLVGDLFECRDLGMVELKGFAKPVKAWRVLRESAVASRFEAMHSAGLTPLVGRDEEVEWLLSRWQHAKSGAGRVLLLSGEPGIGKSRIIEALQEQLEDEPHTLLRCFCSQFHQDSTLYPIISQLERAADFAPDDAPLSKLDKLEALLLQATRETQEVALIADLMLLPIGGRYATANLDPHRRKEKTLNAILAQLAGLAAKQPVLIIFEDAHWVDPTSKELLDLAIERVRSLPILLIITFRPEFSPPWAGRSHVTSLSLNRLGRLQSIAMLMRVTGGKTLPDEVLIQILERTDGIPLYVEEVTKSVLESGLLREEADRYSLSGPLPPFAVPATLHDSLMARLDRLAFVKEMTQIASIIGREFGYELLAALNPIHESDLQAALSQLVTSELVSVQGAPPKATYRFKHALVQDAAYQSLLNSKRQQLHFRTAQILEESFPEIAKSQPELLAYHYANARKDEQAAHWMLLAGDLASRRYAHGEARRLFERALDTLLRLPDTAANQRQRIDATIKLIGVSFAASSPEEHLTRLVQAEELAQKLLDSPEVSAEDASRLTQVQFWLGRSYHYLNQLPDALRYYNGVLKAAEAAGDDALFGESAVMVGRALVVQGRFGQAATLLARALPVLEEKQIWSEFLFGLGFKGLALAARGHCAAGLSEAQRAQKLAVEINYSTGIAASHILLWGVYQQSGDAKRMVDESRAIVQVAERAGDKMYVYLGYGMLAWAEALDGNLEAALSHMGRSQNICDSLGGRAVLADWFSAMNAEIFLRAGRPQEALRAAEEAVAVATAAGGIFAEGLSRRTWGAALMRLDSKNWDDAQIQLAASLRAFEAGEACVEAARTHLAWGSLCLAQRDYRGAMDHLTAAAEQFDASGLSTESLMAKSTMAALPRLTTEHEI
jgi:tetratricopeptide (TPR) repeat protein